MKQVFFITHINIINKSNSITKSLLPRMPAILSLVTSSLRFLQNTQVATFRNYPPGNYPISYPESSGFLVSASRDSGTGGSDELVSSVDSRCLAIVTSQQSKRADANDFRKWQTSRCLCHDFKLIFLC